MYMHGDTFMGCRQTYGYEGPRGRRTDKMIALVQSTEEVR